MDRGEEEGEEEGREIWRGGGALLCACSLSLALSLSAGSGWKGLRGQGRKHVMRGDDTATETHPHPH